MTPPRMRRKMMQNAYRRSMEKKKEVSIISSKPVKRKIDDSDNEDIVIDSPQVVFERKKPRHATPVKKARTQTKPILDESVICLTDIVGKKNVPRAKKVPNNIDESVIIIDDIDKVTASTSKAPDDLAIVWSNCSKKEKEKKKKETADSQLFFEDRTPNLEYVSLINKQTQPWKRKGVQQGKVLKKQPKRLRKQKFQNQVPKSVPKLPPPPSSDSDSSDSEPQSNDQETGQLREIVVDGCNIARAFSKNKGFDEKGIQIVVDYFQKKGHVVTVFVPQHKRSQERPLLERYHKEGIVVFTASRKVGGKTIASYDDRYILDYATQKKGIVVSLDHFRDLYEEKPEWRHTISKRILQPTFARGMVMFPEDPLGRNGPTLYEFLRHKRRTLTS